MYVTKLWMKIINLIDDKPMRLETIAEIIGYDNNHASRILNHLIGLECVVKKGHYFQSVKKNYVVSTHNKIKAVKASIGEKIDLPPIYVDRPDDKTCHQIKLLAEKNVTRSEIARQLKIRKQQVLWALSGVMNG